MDRRSHWENVYQTKQAADVSWFESEPGTSLDLIQGICFGGGQIIDIGGGASFLVDRLVATGGWKVTVLDISATALALAQARLGELAAGVRWIQADITQATLLDTYDLWHDRAVFHFLTIPEDRRAYLARLNLALRPGGHAVFGTFGLRGPEKCSGLLVCRYDARTLTETLGPDYTLVQELEHEHLTPAGKVQVFQFAVFRKVAASHQRAGDL